LRAGPWNLAGTPLVLLFCPWLFRFGTNRSFRCFLFPSSLVLFALAKVHIAQLSAFRSKVRFDIFLTVMALSSSHGWRGESYERSVMLSPSFRKFSYVHMLCSVLRYFLCEEILYCFAVLLNIVSAEVHIYLLFHEPEVRLSSRWFGLRYSKHPQLDHIKCLSFLDYFYVCLSWHNVAWYPLHERFSSSWLVAISLLPPSVCFRVCKYAKWSTKFYYPYVALFSNQKPIFVPCKRS
jgi:hypothetical protein